MSNTSRLPIETTHHVRDSCLCLHLQRAARSIGRRFDTALQPFALTNGQFSLLVALSPPKPKGVGQVASVLAMDRTTLTAALKPLQRRGLVAITVGKEDRRSRVLSLTQAGHDVLLEALPVWQSMHDEIERDLSSPNRLREELRGLS